MRQNNLLITGISSWYIFDVLFRPSKKVKYGCFYEIINCDAKELNILTYTYFFEKIKFSGCLVNKTVRRRLLIEKNMNFLEPIRKQTFFFVHAHKNYLKALTILAY